MTILQLIMELHQISQYVREVYREETALQIAEIQVEDPLRAEIEAKLYELAAKI